MENSLTTLLSTLIGGAIAIVTQYFIEYRKSKNEKYKFSLKKIISVGEKFYTLSGYALNSFEASLESFEQINNFNTDEAKQVYLNVEKAFQEQLKLVQQNRIAITSADIYFNVSGVEKANSWKNSHTRALATLVEIVNSNAIDKRDKQLKATDDVKKSLREIITTIKKDQRTINLKIKKMLELDKNEH